MNLSPKFRLLLSIPLFALCINVQANGSAATHSLKRTSTSNNGGPDTGGEFADFGDWHDVHAFIDMMVTQHGFSRPELESTIKNARYIASAVQLIKPAPVGQAKNWQAYRARFVEPTRITAGVAFWDSHAEALAREEREFGVPAEIVVGILGVETLFGRQTGNFRVMDVLTTLAFAYPDTPTRVARMEYFRSELENALLFARESDIDPFTLRGSYAGAIGYPQFMPASIRKYAVDYDGDGKIDLRNSPDDAIGSVGNYLAQHGWRCGEPTVFAATVATPVDNNQGNNWPSYINQGLEAKFTLDELQAAGVQSAVVPPSDIKYGLVDLQNGSEPTEYWLGTPNFFAITQYNRSYFYAMSVIDLGKSIRSARDADERNVTGAK